MSGSASFREQRGEAVKRLMENGHSTNGEHSSRDEGTQPAGTVRGGRGFLFAKKSVPAPEPAGVPDVPKSTGFGRAKLFQRVMSSNTSAAIVAETVTLPSEAPSLESLNLRESSNSPEFKPPISATGTSGTPIKLVTNYIRLHVEEGRGIYQYAVSFTPEIDSKIIRVALMRSLVDVVGDHRSTFDGAILYLPHLLKEKVTVAQTKLRDGTPVTVSIMFVKKLSMGENLAVHFYCVLFRKIMNMLGLSIHGRKFIDPKAAHIIHEHKLEVWPGYVTAIQEYEDGVMLCCDSSYRVLRSQTVHEAMMDLESISEGDSERFQKELINMLVGQTVLTRYNNKSYRVEDVDFDSSPNNTFTMKNGSEISYVQYYSQQHNITIKDLGQPLLKSFVKATVRGEEKTQFVDLIPELCYLSGITDPMRNDHRLMKSIHNATRLAPPQRQAALEKFLHNITSNPEARSLLADWGLSLSKENLTLPGRLLDPLTIYFGNNTSENGSYACDWTRGATNNPLLGPVDLTNWAVICPKRDQATVREFLTMCGQVSRRLSLRIQEPQLITLPNDNTSYYLQELRKLRGSQKVQLVLVVLSLSRADKYSAIKKMACLDNPTPSQVVITKTLRNQKSLRSVTQKIVLQMNCKLGGPLWQVSVPVKKTMVLGFDTYHDGARSNSSVGAVVASLNESLTTWYSTIYRQEVGKELIDGLEMAFTRCLMKTNQVNGFYPEQIIVYRDGVGDGALKVCSEFEVAQLHRACKKISADYSPKILFVVVQKNIMTRLAAVERGQLTNPPPGTIMDHSITRRDMYDFFLVSQNVRQGTVSPTHYIVIHNSTSMTPDRVQRFSYMMTHLYYNWCGTIRVPAPCQYAHKLAYLVGEHLHKEVDESLSDKLFYL